MRRIYLSGPMTGIDDLNRPLFKRYENTVRAMGFNPINPHDIKPTDAHGLPYTGEAGYDHFLLSDIEVLVKCDGILMLPGWEQSRGAKVELEIALVLGHCYFETLDGLMSWDWGMPAERAYATKIVNASLENRI